tara:strand:- start:122 stop:493 length:372 start_codon:yes stop_codon:yes gene_type:complete
MYKRVSVNVNIVLYSHGEPFTSTKNKLIETISKFTSKNVIIHDYDLRRIMKSSWWNKIKELPNIKGTAKGGRRDGYYNCWKPFIVNEVNRPLVSPSMLKVGIVLQPICSHLRILVLNMNIMHL